MRERKKNLSLKWEQRAGLGDGEDPRPSSVGGIWNGWGFIEKDDRRRGRRMRPQIDSGKCNESRGGKKEGLLVRGGGRAAPEGEKKYSIRVFPLEGTCTIGSSKKGEYTRGQRPDRSSNLRAGALKKIRKSSRFSWEKGNSINDGGGKQ